MDAFKKLALGLILLSPFRLFADEKIQTPVYVNGDIEENIIGPFGTLNDYDNSEIIPATQAQDLLNVDITPGGRSVKKRRGFTLGYTLNIATSPTHGTYRFFNSGAQEVDLFFNDTDISSIVGSGNLSVIVTTATFGATWQCTDSAGTAYCVNSNHDTPIQTNGATVSALSGSAPLGSIITNTPDRLIISGISGSPSRIDFSQSGTFTNFAAPFNLGTDPNQIFVNSPGSKITHVTYAFGRVVWFKDNSFGYILVDNTNLANWQVIVVSPIIGSLDNTSIYWQNILYFHGQDEHYYAFDGTNVTRISRDITPIVNQTQSKIPVSWTQTSQADWNAGSFLPPTYIDTVTYNGSIFFQYPDTFPTFRNGQNGTLNLWNQYCVGSGCTPNYSVNNPGGLNMTANQSIDQIAATVLPTANYAQGTTFYMTINSMSKDAVGNTAFEFALSSYSASISPGSLNSNFLFTFISTETNRISLNSIRNSSDGSICASPSACGSSEFFIPQTIQIWISTTNYAVTMGQTLVKSGTHTWPNKQVYSYLDWFWGTTGSGSINFTDFGVIPETSTFYSAVNNAPNLTAWSSFSATYGNGSQSSNTFYIRAATNSFTVNSSTPTWNSISNGQIPTLSTGTYFQIRDDIVTTVRDDTPNLSDFTVNWFEGTAADKVYGGYFDYALWWNVQLGQGSNGNDRVLKYDLINNGWIIYDIPMNGFIVKNNKLTFGSSNSGKIYVYGGNDDDAGSAINAYWKSKDFFGRSPFLDKEIGLESVSFVSQANSNLTVNTIVDKSTTTYSWNVSLFNPRGNYGKWNKMVTTGLKGNTFNMQFGNNAINQPFEVTSCLLGVRSGSWKASINPEQ